MQVVGISVDSAQKNAAFADEYGLRMPLLCDTDRSITAAFGAEPAKGYVARRCTFLIDGDGTIRRVYPSVMPKGHARKVLAAVRDIWG